MNGELESWGRNCRVLLIYVEMKLLICVFVFILISIFCYLFTILAHLTEREDRCTCGGLVQLGLFVFSLTFSGSSRVGCSLRIINETT